MGKRGPQPKYGQPMTEQLNIALPPNLKILADETGGLDYWREVLQIISYRKMQVDAGELPPEEFASVVGGEVAQVTGIPGNDPPPDSKAYKIEASDVETVTPGTPLSEKPEFKKMVEKMKDQESADSESGTLKT